MGFNFYKKNKDKNTENFSEQENEIFYTDTGNKICEQINDKEESLNNQKTIEEEEKVSKVYIYIAFKDDKIFIGKNGECVLSNTLEVENPENVTEKDWATKEFEYKLYAKREYRCELKKPGSEDKRAKKNWEDTKKKAKDDLRTKFASEINAAKASLLPKEKEELETKTYEEPKTKSYKEKTDNFSNLASDEMKKIESKIISELEQLGRDIADSESDTTETIVKSVNDKLDSVSDSLHNIVKKSDENITTVTREISNDIVHNVKLALSNSSSRLQNDTKKNQEEIIKGTKLIQKKVDKIDEICEATEMIEGKLAKLDQLETITNILSEKGVEVSRDFPPTCEEEEDILNLVRYSKKITEQLGYAARDLIRKKAYYDSKDQNFANEQAIIEKKILDSRSEGVAEGKLFVLKSLLSKYADVDTIMESEYDHIHVLWSLMQELDVTIDGDGKYKKGNKLDFSEDEVERMVAIYTKVDGAGTYNVVKTGLRYGNEILFKAEFEKVQNEEIHLKTETNDNGEVMENQKENTDKTPYEEVEDKTPTEENGESAKVE